MSNRVEGKIETIIRSINAAVIERVTALRNCDVANAALNRAIADYNEAFIALRKEVAILERKANGEGREEGSRTATETDSVER